MFRLGRAPRWYHRALLLSLVLGFLLSLGGAGTPVSADPGPPVRLSGHVLAVLSRSTLVGPTDATKPLILTVALRPPVPNSLRDAAASTAGAGPAANALSVADIGRQFGRSSADLNTLSSYFASFGLIVSPPPPDHLSISVHGSAVQVQRALAITLNDYVDPRGHAFYATSVDPALPANLAAMVQAIFGLDDYAVFQSQHTPIKPAAVTPAPKSDSPASTPVPGAYTPSNIVTAYNIQPLYNAGRNGAGQTIGVIGCDAFNPSDIQSFRATYGLPPRSIDVVNVDGGASGSDPETTLDLEWSGAIATGAAIRFYGFPASSSGGCPFQGTFDAISRAVNDNSADVLSISLGACETYYSANNDLSSFENEFAVATLNHQSVMVASGDTGGYCDTTYSMVDPDYPASSANVTAVGGTTLSLNGDSTYESESAWGAFFGDCGEACGSGGGISQYISEPSWQNSDGINSGGMRQVPDVALDADPATGYVIYFQGGPLGGVGGTSVAAPEWAGLTAIANQQAGKRLGLLGPILYGSTVLGAQSSSNKPYHDVTSGNNLVYQAAPGWDYTTGWGSLNAANLIAAMTGTSVCGGASAAFAGTSAVFLPTHYVYLPLVINVACATG